MTLKEKLLSDMKGAQRSKDSLRLNTIRSVISSIKNQEIDLRKELQDEDVLPLITREVKKRKEAATLFEQGGRMDLMEKEKQEHAILQTYLPEQISEEDLRKRIQEVIAETEAEGMKDFGKIMKVLVPEFKGKADNGLIKDLAGEYLN
ncbi:MAG: GatB/YqeY domain-containing protein [Nitrospina sp.]|nr:GatB/YqeY domain-containing protein [Nitrospina sp.]